MTSQVSTEPQSGTSDNTGQQYGKGIQGKPIDLRNLGSPLLLPLFPDAWVISDITISLAMSYFLLIGSL
jgi:hypothetical protein